MNYELIIVNDGSKDKVGRALERYKKLFSPRIKIIHQRNQGANVARNNGFKEARGEYLLFCDADIVMREDMLEKMLRVIREKKCSYVYSSHKFGFKKFRLWEFSSEKLRKMPYIHTTSLINRQDFPGFDENIKRLQDWDLWLTMLENGKEGQWIDDYLFAVKGGGTMSSWMPSFFYKIFPFLPKVRKYKKAVEVIKKKHGLNNL